MTNTQAKVLGRFLGIPQTEFGRHRFAWNGIDQKCEFRQLIQVLQQQMGVRLET